jgi:acyl-coenzyme A thioesterase PaaI-like protein
MTAPGSFYTGADGAYVATDMATSPWNAAHQNGIAIIALMTHLIETTPTLEPMMLARMTVDIVRPTPVGPFAAECCIVREGRRMQNLEVVFRVAGEVTARATALRVRLASSPVSMETLDYPPPEAAPDTPLSRRPGRVSPFETRILSGGLTEPGPGRGWARPVVQVLPGVAASPLVAACMAADIGSGLSSVFEHGAWSFANVDVAVHFTRPPESAWIFIAAETVSAGDGSALVNSLIADERGPFARAHQTLFVEPMRLPSQSVVQARAGAPA